MTTLMTISDSETTRRCDANCHTATKPRCSCICGGRYHGKGDMAEVVHHQDVLAGVYGEDVAEAAKAAREAQATFEEAWS